MAKLDSEPRGAQFSPTTLRPFDKANAARSQVGRQQIRVLGVKTRETVEVEVRHEEPWAGRVPVAERERRARHRRVAAERARRAADERRFAGAELAGQEDDVAVAQFAGEGGPDRLGRRCAGGLEQARLSAQNNPSCVAGAPSRAPAVSLAGSGAGSGWGAAAGAGRAGPARARSAGRRTKSARSVSSVLGV